MDYGRIYNEFIEHRKMLPRLEGEYYEKHHIRPRCLGGGDELENLVYLTFQDHFMAHLLLAKAHNSLKLWNAVKCMKGALSRHGCDLIRHRRTFAVIKKKYKEARRLHWDNKVRLIFDLDNDIVFKMTAREMCDKLGMAYSDVRKVLLSNGTVEGLCSKKYYENLVSTSRQRYDFLNVETGDVTRTTVRSMAFRFGLDKAYLASMVYGYRNTYCNFTLVGRDYKRSCAQVIQYDFRDVVTGKVFRASRQHAQQMYDINDDCMSALIQGHNKTSGGLALASTDLRTPYDLFYHQFQELQTGRTFIANSSYMRNVIGMSANNLSGLIRGVLKKSKGYIYLGKAETLADPLNKGFMEVPEVCESTFSDAFAS